MKLTILLFLFICLGVVPVFAQNNYSVKGVAADSVEHVKLYNTSISVLNAKDSTLVNFTRAGEDGTFAIKSLHPGKFILLVAYPDYADYVEMFTLDSAHQMHNFGNVNMNLKSRILKEVLIKGTAAQIKIKGDTTEYNAKAFQIQPNAKVEDLIKQFPGFQVDKDGKITAHGETISKVLVDGEEFFGDDPTLVTKNLRADMVDKVQLYDKKSDQAAFTGIDDGQKTKTLNIKLREDKKNGYFGKAEGGVGTDDFYTSELLFNRFKGKKKFSFFGIMGNDGKIGLGWQDSQKYGTSNNVQVGDDGGIYIFSTGADDLDSFNGTYNNQGIPTAKTAGVHYDDKWDKDNQSINTNFKIGSLAVDGTNNTLTQNVIPQYGAVDGNTDQKLHNFISREKLDITYQVKLDTMQTLKFSVDGTNKHSNTVSHYTQGQIQTATKDSLTNETRDISNTVDGKIFDASGLYTKKFKKKGRTISLNISEAYNDSQADGFLKSDLTTYTTDGKKDTIVNQRKVNDIRSSVLTTNLAYTEPLTKTLSLIVNYGLIVNNSSANRKSFNQSAPGVYNVLDSIYSNDFKLNQLANQEGAIFNYKKGNNIINFGTKVSEVNFKQINEYTGSIFQRNFINWNPQAMLQHKFSQYSSLYLNYFGNTTQPTVDQIQPVLVNTDPLSQTIGNPQLTPSFTNRFYFYYNSYKVISDKSLWINGGITFTNNPIVNSSVTDTDRTSTTYGKTTTQFININKVPYTFNANINYGRKLPGTEFNIELSLGGNGSKSYSMSNDELNTIILNTYRVSLELSRYVQKKYDFYVSFGPNYTVGNSSLLPGLNNNGHGYDGRAGFTVYLPLKFQIGSDATYEYNSKTETFNQDFSRLLWNAAISKTFFKGDDLKLSIKANDLLNQNAGFQRSVNGNLVSENTYTTIKRYFMLTISWDFNHAGGGTDKK